MLESSCGLILRTRPLTDTSLIVNWLTKDLGRLATVAKGARKSKSPFAGKLDLFYEAEFTFQRSRRSDLHQLREVSLRETSPAIRNDIERLQQAAYFTAVIEQTVEAEAPVPEVFDLVRAAVKHLDSRPAAAITIPAFELRMLELLGLQPELSKLKPDLREIARHLLIASWDALDRLKLTAPQFSSLEKFLENHILFHLGRVPKGRRTALLNSP
jgi:DNA repair protein RecO (recombination protein O)